MRQVFLKTLGGRLKLGAGLRWSGEVRYNGLTTDEFCVERAIGLVDQYDDHLPMLTVRETLVRGFPQPQELGPPGGASRRSLACRVMTAGTLARCSRCWQPYVRGLLYI